MNDAEVEINNDDTFSIDPVATIRANKILVKELEKLISTATIEALFADKTIISTRQRLYNGCLKLMQHKQFRREALQSMWINCFYEPIRLYRTVDGFDEEDCHLLKRFISASIASIAKLLNEYSEYRFILLVNLGDLYRYSYTLCDEDVRDEQTAQECYKKALKSDPENGCPLNQLALLLKKRDVERALSLLLRACIMPKPFSQAMKNLVSLKQEEFANPSSYALYTLIDVLLFNFSRSTFEEARKQFEEFLQEADFENSVKLSHIFSLAAIYVLLNEENDEKFRNIVSFLLRKWNSLMDDAKQKLAEQKLNEEDDQLDKKRRGARRRRRMSSSSSESDVTEVDEEEEEDPEEKERQTQMHQLDPIWGLLISVLEFLSLTGERFYTKKLPVSLKFQFQNLLKSLVDVLNELLPKLRPLMLEVGQNVAVLASQSLISDWFLQSPFLEVAEAEIAKIAAHFVRQCIDGRKVGITFDAFFSLTNNVVEEKEVKAMEAFSKLHLQHVTELYEKASKIPVYIAPDFLVFLHQLSMVEQLITSTKQTVIIARSVLSRLDKIKKENTHAREAIRWIQNCIPKGRVRMLSYIGEKFVTECLKFLDEKGLLGKKTLFCSILTTEEGVEEYTNGQTADELNRYPAIAVEIGTDFIARIANTNESV